MVYINKIKNDKIIQLYSHYITTNIKNKQPFISKTLFLLHCGFNQKSNFFGLKYTTLLSEDHDLNLAVYIYIFFTVALIPPSMKIHDVGTSEFLFFIKKKKKKTLKNKKCNL